MARLDLLRIYDTAVMNWMQGTDRLTITPVTEKGTASPDYQVPVVFATPERSEGAREPFSPGVQSKVPYPYFSVSRVGWAYDWNRRSTVYARHVRRSEDFKSIVEARFPFPIDLYYQIDFWSRLRTHGNLAMLWFAEQFPYEGGEGRIFNIDFRIPWGEKWIRGFIQDIQDLSELESGEDEREIRITLKFKMTGHMFQCYEELQDITYDTTKITYRVPTVLATEVEIVSSDHPDQVLDSFTIPEDGPFLPAESYL